MRKKYLILFLLIYICSFNFADAKVNFDVFKKNNFVKQKATIVVEGKDNPLAMHDDAVAFYNTNDLHNALITLNKIPDEQKTDLDYLMLANIMQDKGDILSAIKYLNKALIINPKFYKPYYNLGNIYLSDNKIDSAIACFKKSIRYNRDFAFGYYNLGVCYVKKEDYKKAKSYFNRAILRKKDEPDFYYNLTFVYKKLGDTKNAQKSLDVYNDLINR